MRAREGIAAESRREPIKDARAKVYDKRASLPRSYGQV